METQLNRLGEIQATEAQKEYLQRALGSLGLFDASFDEYVTPKHDDERWAVRVED